MNGHNFRHCNYLMRSDCSQESPFEHFLDLDLPNVTEWSVVVGVTNGQAQANQITPRSEGSCACSTRGMCRVWEGGRRRERGGEKEREGGRGESRRVSSPCAGD